MNKSIYLSVDLDYWCASETVWTGATDMLKTIAKWGGPTVMVDDHGDMLEHINKHPCQLLVNVDAHSDIWNYDAIVRCGRECDCSNWVNYVRWQQGQEFLWLHPHAPKSVWEDGACHGDAPNPFYKKNLPSSAWKKASKKRGEFPAAWWKNVQAVGIAISEAWLDESKYVEDAIRFALRYNIRVPDIEKVGLYRSVNQGLLKRAKARLRR